MNFRKSRAIGNWKREREYADIRPRLSEKGNLGTFWFFCGQEKWQREIREAFTKGKLIMRRCVENWKGVDPWTWSVRRSVLMWTIAQERMLGEKVIRTSILQVNQTEDELLWSTSLVAEEVQQCRITHREKILMLLPDQSWRIEGKKTGATSGNLSFKESRSRHRVSEANHESSSKSSTFWESEESRYT